MKFFPLFVFSGLCSLGITRAVLAAPATPAAMAMPAPVIVAVSGDLAKPGTWTPAQIEKLAPAQNVTTMLKGKPYVVKGIPLRALIEAAGPRFPAATKHPEARFIVLVSGKDGYTASFSWAELQSDISDKNALIIWEANGAPLPADDGPLRVVVPGDAKPMRWVYSLTSVRVYDGARYDK